MVDDALQYRLDGIILLLVMIVSLLSGLVFGRDYGGEAFFALVSFGVLGGILIVNPFAERWIHGRKVTTIRSATRWISRVMNDRNLTSRIRRQ